MAEHGTPSLEVDGLRVRIDGAVVFEDVSLVAPAGRTTAVLGPSGCGKTTLLRAVCGLVTPDAGRVLAGGRDLTGMPAHRRGIGLAFQDRALFPHLDVAANVAFGLRMAGAPGAERSARVAEVLDLVGLGGFGSRRVGSLSGGEAQRVALARALAPDPAVLCLDEPLGSLDRVLHDRLVEDLRHLFDSLATTVLLVTHDHTEALALADHLVLLGGTGPSRVLAAGAPRDVWLRPPSLAAARGLGLQVLDATAALRLGVPASVVGGAPWVVVHAGAVRLWPGEGALVTDELFAGGRTTLTVMVDGVGAVRSEGWGGPTVGDRVGVAVDPGGVCALTS